MTVAVIIISILITFLITFLLAKLHIFDFIASFSGCGGFVIIRLLLVGVVFAVSFFFVSTIVEEKITKAKASYDYKFDLSSVYITTKMELTGYKKILKKPYGREDYKLPVGTVIKVKKFKKKGTITWIEAFEVTGTVNEKFYSSSELDAEGDVDIESVSSDSVDFTARHMYVLIPSLITDIKRDSAYFSSASQSDLFNDYIEYIDFRNMMTEVQVRKDFLTAINEKGIIITTSNDFALYETIKKSHFILPKEGYFEEFVAESGEFLYVSKKQKRALLKIVKAHKKRLKKETRTYF